MTTIAAALEILHLTHDGNDLDPQHLKLLECAVNGQLSATGLRLFHDLYAQVLNGYRKPWLHGVEHMTRDHDGYVLWKGIAVEHFSASYANSDEARAYVQELARRCAILDRHGIPPDTTHVVWRWPDDHEADAESPRP